MKIVHVPFCFHPDPVGGTEVYVESLAQSLQSEHGGEILIVAPGEEATSYDYKGVQVQRLPVAAAVADLAELYGDGDESAARRFGQILDEKRPDIVHLHAFTRGVSLRLVRAAKSRNIPVVFTYHTPTVTCTRGTMVEWGIRPSDGTMLGRRCTACTLHGLGLNRVAANILASTPRFLRQTFAGRKCGGVWTALRMRDLVEQRHEATRALFAEVDHVVAVAEWVRRVLLRNGVPPEKLTLCRQGIENSGVRKDRGASVAPQKFTAGHPLRLAYFGRLDPMKGIHLLIGALKMDTALPVRLDIYATGQGKTATVYKQRLRKLARGDARVAFKSPIQSGEVVATMGAYDAVVVPSQWLETGPLVVLEAFAAEVPVIGSDLGGIAELIQNGVNGSLVKDGAAENWLAAFRQVIAAPETLIRYAGALPRARTMRQVADEMMQLYTRLLERESAFCHE